MAFSMVADHKCDEDDAFTVVKCTNQFIAHLHGRIALQNRSGNSPKQRSQTEVRTKSSRLFSLHCG